MQWKFVLIVVELKALQVWMVMEWWINCFCFTFLVGFWVVLISYCCRVIKCLKACCFWVKRVNSIVVYLKFHCHSQFVGLDWSTLFFKHCTYILVLAALFEIKRNWGPFKLANACFDFDTAAVGEWWLVSHDLFLSPFSTFMLLVGLLLDVALEVIGVSKINVQVMTFVFRILFIFNSWSFHRLISVRIMFSCIACKWIVLGCQWCE